jgi:hypothetical protein
VRSLLSITVYRLPTKERNSVLCFYSQQKNGSSPFPFFRLQQTNGNCRDQLVPFSVCIYIYGKRHYSLVIYCTYTYTYLYAPCTHMYNAVSNGKLKPRRFYYLIHLPFAHRANGSSSPVRLFMKEQMDVICQQTDVIYLQTD